MRKTSLNLPLLIGSPPGVVESELAPLLEEPFASAWNLPAPAALGPALRDRLIRRVAASREAEILKTTRRRRRAARQSLAPGVIAETLYAAPADRELRPGEPLRARLLELAAGAWLAPEALGDEALLRRHRDLLVLSGSIELPEGTLSQRDYHLMPAGVPMPTIASAQGALLFLREADLPARPGDRAVTVLDAEAGWPALAPGIQRRVLWQRDGQAAMLYYAQPGARVPHHAHRHDEECLMLQGALFLDDVLLQTGDYQLAPAGTGHQVTHTDCGVVVYAHGDLDIHFVR